MLISRRNSSAVRSAPAGSTPAGSPPAPAPKAQPKTARSAPVDGFDSGRRNLSVDGTITDPADGGRPDFAQGNSNACGTTCLAIVLHRLGIEVPRTEIDKSIRNYNLFTPPTALVDYARGQGLRADVYNHGSFEQLQSDLAEGRQIMVMTDVGGYDQNLDLSPGSKKDFQTHWLVVTGAYEKNGQKFVTYDNPWGTKETLPFEKFDALWKDVHVLGVPTGYDRSYVLIDRGSSKALRAPHAGDIAGVNELTGGISNAANGFAEMTHGNILHGLGRMLSGVGNTVVGAARTAVQTVKNLFGRLF